MLLFQSTSRMSLVQSFSSFSLNVIPGFSYSQWTLLTKPERSSTLGWIFGFVWLFFEGELLALGTRTAALYQILMQFKAAQELNRIFKCPFFFFFLIAVVGGRTNKQNTHQKKVFAHPVSVTTGEVDFSQPVCINEPTQERYVCGLLRGRSPLFNTGRQKV